VQRRGLLELGNVAQLCLELGDPLAQDADELAGAEGFAALPGQRLLDLNALWVVVAFD